MDFDRQEAYDLRALREPRETSPPSKRQFSLRTLMLVVVPVAILSLMFRWLMENGLLSYVLNAGMMGSLLGCTMAMTFAMLFYPFGKTSEQKAYFLRWSYNCFCAGMYGGFCFAGLLAVSFWFSQP